MPIHIEFQYETFKAFDFTGGHISHVPIDFCLGLMTVLCYRAACECGFLVEVVDWLQLFKLFINRVDLTFFV